MFGLRPFRFPFVRPLMLPLALLGSTTGLASEPGVAVLHADAHFASQLTAAVERANAGEIHTIRFAAGTFQVTQPIRIHRHLGQPGVSIIGAGPGLTRLEFLKIETGIEVTLDTDIEAGMDNPSVSVSELSLIANGPCGTAIRLQRGDPSRRGGISPKVLANLEIGARRGDSRSAWDQGIHAHELTFVTIRDVTFRGPVGRGTAIRLSGDNDPVDHHLNSVRILGGEVGLRVEGSTEGVYVHQATMIACDIGIDWATTSYEPLLSLTGSHINARRFCVRASHLLQPILQGNLFYQASPDLRWHGVAFITPQATPYDLVQIANNIFHGDPHHTAPNVGLAFTASSGGVVAGNVFSATDTGIRLEGDASGFVITDSVFKNQVGTEIERVPPPATD